MQGKKSKVFVVVMAGGGGTRFWPWSREGLPKQVLPIISHRSMIWETVNRVRPLAPPGQTFIVTSRAQAKPLHREVPQIPRCNLLLEPVGRNTAPCLCLAALQIHKIDPEAVMIGLPADHFIGDRRGFLRTLRAAAEFAASRDFLVTLGIRPLEPETGYGYIQKGEPLGWSRGLRILRAKAFWEKPTLRKARAYLRRGDSLWNSGIFIWKAGVFLKAVQKCLPELYRDMAPLQSRLGTPRAGRALDEVYPRLPSVSVDYAIMERAENVALIEADFLWNDVGTFASLAKIWPKDQNGNTLIRPCGRAKILTIDSSNCLVRGEEKLIALLGLKDLVVVEAGNAILICPRDRAQEVRRFLPELQKKGWKEHL